MSTTTTTKIPARKPETELAVKIAAAMEQQQWADALRLAEQGKADHPTARLFGRYTFDDLIATAVAKLGTPVAEPVAEPEKAKSRRRTSAPKVSPAVQAEIAEAERAEQDHCAAVLGGTAQETALPTLTLAHTVSEGTRLLGSPRADVGKRVSAVMGKNGARWAFHLRDGYWFVPGSMGKGADQVRMYNAQLGLKADGFPVEWAVDDVDHETGQTLPAHVAKAERLRRDAAYGERLSAIRWHLDNSDGLPCIECGTMLAKDVAHVVYEPKAELPVVTCPADVNGREQAPESITAEPEPVAAPMAIDDAATQAQALIAALMGGDADAGKALVALVAQQQAPRRAARTATPKAPKVAKVAEIKADEPLMGPQQVELWFAVGNLPDGQQAQVRKTASALRSALTWGVANKYRKTGVEFHVYADRSARRLQITVTVTAATLPVWVKIQQQTAATALQVPGVVNA